MRTEVAPGEEARSLRRRWVIRAVLPKVLRAVVVLVLVVDLVGLWLTAMQNDWFGWQDLTGVR